MTWALSWRLWFGLTPWWWPPPTYFLGANASLKRLLDRGLSFYAHIDAPLGKTAVGVAIAGVAGLEG